MAKQIKTNVTVGEEYEFLDTNGNHIFSICINSADVGIVKRADDIVDFMNNLSLSDMLEIPESSDESNKKQEGADTRTISMSIESAEKVLAEKLDHLFNAPISEAIFSVMNPFTPLKNGKLYIEEVIERICGAIEEELEQRTKKLHNRMNRYTAKYHK